MPRPYSDGTGVAPHPTAPAQTTASKEVPIPQPPPHLFGLLGNLPDMDPAFPARSIWNLANIYGPIFKLDLRKPIVIVSSQKLVNEIADENRFEKRPSAALIQVRDLLFDGLFTAFPEEKNWWKAHRTLVPAFGPLGIRQMFDGMLDISSQMVLRWDRLGPDHDIECSDDLTRLAFDTIGLCAFNYRFNEFYSDNAHPFAQQMAEVLLESGKRANRTEVQNLMYHSAEQKRQENVQKMHALSDEIIAERKRNPKPEVKDLLNTMLNATDRETGEKLSDENIRYNMCTFLVAGHETTSATLSFTYFNLLKHPEKLHKAQLQVDEVVGNGVLKLEHLAKLDYIDACIKETLRMSAPIAAWSVSPKEDTLLDGKYKVTNDMYIQVNVKGLHRDRTVWGDDVEVFRPERFLNGGFQALPPNSWKPFGSGMRACIGRTFAEQEMIMNIALVLQRFQIELADPAYALQLKSTLTIKPDHFRMKVRRRPGKTLMTGIPGGIPSEIAKNHEKKSQDMHEQGPKGDNLSPILIFFGGNTGTCEGFAQDIESKASSYGLHATIKSLNLATEDIPKDQPVIFITASYEGKPPDNAKKFITWLEQLENPSHLKGVNYTVFGVGNSDWSSTFHRIPKLVDETMTKLGATRFLEAGYTNVKTDLVGPWEDWSEKLFEALAKTTGATKTEESKLSITIQNSESAQRIGGPEMKLGAILVNRELADSSIGPAKRHMEIRLPEGSQYTPGDYLVVTPHNPPETVHRILARFGLVPDDVLTFSGSKKKFLPAVPVAVGNFLFTTVELNTPITRRQVGILASHATGELKSKLDRLQEEEPYATLLAKRYSVIDLLEELMLDIPFEVYIDMLQSLLPRQYSISSSPLHPSSNPSGSEHADVCSLTYDILSGPSFSSPDRVYNGVCSTYLATRRPGDLIPCFVRSTNIGFRLPTNPETPVIMIAAGTGLAPMRAFLQERAAIASAGINKLGPAILFFGCRYEDKDYIYRDELLSFQKDGIVEVETAFSRQSGKLGKGTYVQDVLWEHREKVAEMFRAGGKIFLCGSATKLGKSVSETCKKIYIERLGCSEQEAEEWLERVKEDRFVSDVFG